MGKHGIYSSHGLGNHFFLRRSWWWWFLSSYGCSGRYSNSKRSVSTCIVLLLLLALLVWFSICENFTQEFFIVVKKHIKLTILPIFFSRVKFSSIKFSNLVEKQICRTCPSATTETLYPLNNSPLCCPATPGQHRSTWYFYEGDFPSYCM